MNTNIQWLILLICVVIATIAVYEKFDRDPSVAEVELARMTAVAEFQIKEKMTAMVKPISTVQVNDSTEEATYEWETEYNQDSLTARVVGICKIQYRGSISKSPDIYIRRMDAKFPIKYTLFQSGDKLRLDFTTPQGVQIKPSRLETKTAKSKLLRGSLLAGAEPFPPYSPIFGFTFGLKRIPLTRINVPFSIGVAWHRTLLILTQWEL